MKKKKKPIKRVTEKQRHEEYDKLMDELTEVKVLLKVRGPGDKVKLSFRFIKLRERVMVKLVEEKRFNLKTKKNFEDFWFAVNCLAILQMFKKNVKKSYVHQERLGLYISLMEVFDEQMKKELYNQFYKRKK